MLKALELVGFKSFADKTRFEFPPGITVIVGPNGSGKSNIVDAIKWSLGEQSVKSLRGQEMADVIFNGSNTRRGMNSCEITLTFDNSNHLFPIDTPEVHITRRVYRGGEGEYLINRGPVRLRDIREMLSGTGMGTQAYSVIEQGKVDVLLQSSPRERRVIFEEAAGISRFKLKKIEALRRLERVDQNLLRLRDIVTEVENRLRSVRLQAGKARRYKDYADRLQELRTWVALVDWRRLSRRLAEFDAELQSFRDQRDASNASAEAIDARVLQIDVQTNELRQAGREAESRIAANRERIAAAESSIEHERARHEDLEQEIARLRRQLVALSARAGDAGQQLQDTINAVETAEQEHRQIGVRLVEGERALTEVMSRLDHLRNENQQRRADYVDQMRSAAALGNEISRLESQIASAEATRQRSINRLAGVDGQLQTLSADMDGLLLRQEQLAEQVQQCEAALQSANDLLARHQGQLARRHEELAGLRQRQSGAAERAAVLEELERRHEGLSPGVKEVLEAAQNAPAGPYGGVCGLVADVFSVGIESAPLVDAALGQTAQHVVVAANEKLWEHLQTQSHRLSGRVGFIWLEEETDSHSEKEIDLQGRSGVVGRADRFVETQPRFARLAKRLLGSTWIVENLAQAMKLSRGAGAGLNFVTLAGDLISADGTVMVGPRHAATGLISRRSQLRALKAQLEELDRTIQQAAADAVDLEQKISKQQQHIQTRSAEHRRSLEAQSECRLKISTAEERRAQLDQQRSLQEAEHRAAAAQHDAACARLAEVTAKHRQCDAALAEMEIQLAGVNEQIDQLENQRQSHGRETTQIKVDLAKSEERLGNLRARMKQFEETRQERRSAIADARGQLDDCARRAESTAQNILREESQLAGLYLRKESFATETIALGNELESLSARHSELTAEVQKIRGKTRKIEEKLHAQDLAANELRLQRGGLADRLREDYGIELAELDGDTSAEKQQEREQVQQEIDDLRRKLSNLGNVNLEALDELRELETRFETLSGQYNDLAGAKDSLERIIQKINADSRRLFAETLETVKGHFQTLFRDLFGGGNSDILLEEGVDILDSGVDIVARPPGKELRSISLLSGGEKTLTCVALLLAIFRSHPSPFCVLDEVDAALDEVNIDRFTKVLQDFLAWTQFIIVTHSKKTMTAANTIYGVTMQESGVSKQVSVRFEDVSDDGKILQERPAASEVEAA
jgi:chromosome segregation protein